MQANNNLKRTVHLKKIAVLSSTIGYLLKEVEMILVYYKNEGEDWNIYMCRKNNFKDIAEDTIELR